jgi:DNA gyrase subunit A
MDVVDTDDLIITCKSGVTIRTSINEIREAGRATQGVKLIRLDEGDEIAATSKIGDQGEDPEADLAEREAAVEGSENSENNTASDAPSNNTNDHQDENTTEE